MCGFAGFVDHSGRIGDPDAVLRAMSAAVAHRGPDGEGAWVERRLGVGLAHRRLAILDRSPAGAQPMASPGGRWMVVYNGEIWNYRDLRADLEAAGTPVSASTGDTAVLCAALDAHGVEGTLPRLDGMFAFAALDLHERVLWLARDRFGVKPCFWGHADDGRGAPAFVFGSELRALAAFPGFRNKVSPFAVAAVLGSLAVRGERTVWEGLHALLPGHALCVELGSGRIVQREWFSVRRAAAAARAQGFHGDRAGMVRAFDGLLESAVRRRLASDVPVGALLSGGIDSSLVAASMRHAGVSPLRTFTVGFEHHEYDERPYARAVARSLGTEHHDVLVPDADLPSLVEDAIGCFDAPFADSSAIATLAVARAARGSVGVVLSGDGGDEFFGGYERHLRGHQLAQLLRSVPLFARRRMAAGLELLGGDAWDRVTAPLGPLLPRALRRTQRGRLVHKLAGILRSRDEEELWRSFFAVWPEPASLIPQLPSDLWDATVTREAKAMPRRLPSDADGFFDEMMLRDQSGYLPDDVLVKMDRCTMECGLEARDPMLDLRLFEFAWRIPPAWRSDGTVGKLLLRDALRQRLPKPLHGISSRPKQGFGVPMRAWLSGPLAEWADGALDRRRLDAQGILDGRAVREALDRARAGDEAAAQRAWTACVVARWFEREGVDGSRVARG
jgi:asparagine synthase (glutamine-hydrolysing)